MQRQFNIRLWFAIAGFGILGLIWAGSAWWLVDFMTRSLLERESEVSQEFLQSIVDVEGAGLFKIDPHKLPRDAHLLRFAAQIAGTPGLMRANIYSLDKTILWSTEEQIIGRTFADNEDLEQALKGNRFTEINSLEHHKTEYVAVGAQGLFIEAYLPIRSNDAEHRVVGVIELYKFPTELNATIDRGRRIVWLSVLGAAMLAYFTLYWIVQRGAQVIESQQKLMHNLQAAALIGEFASAVAHSLRNPMAVIRSSAELWRHELPPGKTIIADEIVNEIDRMNEYVRDLLDYANSDKSKLRPHDPMTTVSTVLARRESALRRNKIVARPIDRRPENSEVLVDPLLFEHAITSIVTNAIEAMPDGGILDVTISHDTYEQCIIIEIGDSGPGIPPELISYVTESYFTTKSKGLGLGLALAQGVIERWAGTFSIASSREKGTIVSIALKKA